MGYTKYVQMKNRELCNTCQKHAECEFWLSSKPVLGCVDYKPYDGVTTCPVCRKLYVVGRDVRCRYCGSLTLLPPGWRPLWADVGPEGEVKRVFKTRPMKVNEPTDEFVKILLRNWKKLAK